MSATQKEDLKKRAISGIIYLVARKIFLQAVITLSNIALARLLFPSDFGTFAIIVFVIAFVHVFTDIGFAPAIVAKKEKISFSQIQTAFSTQLLLIVIVVSVLFLISPTIASFYKQEQLSNLLRLYSLTLFALPFKNLAKAVLERDLFYKRVVFGEIFNQVTTSGFVVLFAFSGFGVSSFIFGHLIGEAAAAGFYYFLFPLPLVLKISIKNLKELLHFGFPYQTTMFLGLFYSPLIFLFLGRVVGQENLGFFQFAASISLFPMVFAEVVSRLAFPLGARLKEDLITFKKTTETAILVMSFTSIPLASILAAVAPQLINLVYTARWLPALPAFYLGLAQSVVFSFTLIFQFLLLSLGKASTIRNMAFFWAVLTWIVAPPLIFKFNFVGMSLASLLVYTTGIWLMFRLKKEVNFAWFENFAPYFISSIIAGLTAFVLINRLSENFLNLFLAILIGGVCYLGLTLIFSRKVLFENFQIIFSALKTG